MEQHPHPPLRAESVYAFAEAEIPVYSDNTGKSGYNNKTTSSVGVPLGDGSTTTTNYATSSLSAKERLQELEGIKDCLTEQEYKDKRQDILGSI